MRGTEPMDDAGDLRSALVDQLVARQGIEDPVVEAALRRVPRHHFLPQVTADQAYADVPVVTRRDTRGMPLSSASQPAMVALMLAQLELKPGMRVLEIGAGTGYNAALLAEIVGLAGHVTTVDIDPEIAASARERLERAGLTPERVTVRHADGAAGWEAGAPYDRIIVTAGAWNIAPAWRDQVRDGGLLVAPLGIQTHQFSLALERQGARLVSRSQAPCGFLPLRGVFASPEMAVALPSGGVARGDPPLPPAAELRRLLSSQPRTRRLTLERPDTARLAALLPGPAINAPARFSPQDQRETAGLVTADGESACFALPSGPAGLALAEYGAPTAANLVETRVREWQALGSPALATWRFVFAPEGAAPSARPGTIPLAKPGWRAWIEL